MRCTRRHLGDNANGWVEHESGGGTHQDGVRACDHGPAVTLESKHPASEGHFEMEGLIPQGVHSVEADKDVLVQQENTLHAKAQRG